MPDVLIIGAGPAGCAAAILLARHGWAVTLVEQHRFPRDKVCGECLSALGADVIGRLGLGAALRSAGAVRFGRTAVFAPDGGSFSAALPRPMWGLSRAVFDAMLLDAARAAGVEVRQPVRCEGVTFLPPRPPGEDWGEGERQAARSGEKCLRDDRSSPFALTPTLSRGERGKQVEVCLRDTATNDVHLLHPSFVLLADGKGSLAGPAPPATGDFGLKAHFTDVDGPRDAIELFATAGRYGGLAAVEGGRWNAAFSVSAGQVRECRGDFDRLFARLVTGNRALARRMRRAARTGDWLAAPLPRFAPAFDDSLPPNVLPVGNAAAALEPIGGEGIGLALRSGELAAAALAARGDAWTDEDRRRLVWDFRRLWRTRRAACRAAALAVTSRWFGRLLGGVQTTSPAIVWVMNLIGKE